MSSVDILYDMDGRSDPFFVDYERARDALNGPSWHDGLIELEELARRGSIMSMLFVADAMRDGWKYDQDLPGAEAWYSVAVESGSARGLVGLGLTYLLMGRFSEAIENIEGAIARTYPPAYNSLAGIYFRGDGVPINRPRALELWRQGAAFGHLPAKRNLILQLVYGSNGFQGRIEGVLKILPYAFEMGRVKATNPDTDRLR